MKPKLILLLLALFFYSLVQAQLVFKYGPELGMTVFLFPKSTVNKTVSSIHSPLIGFTTQTTIGKHMLFTLGAHYQKTEEKGYQQLQGYSVTKSTNFTSDFFDEQLFHKLCFPVNVGYAINIWRFQPAIFVGYRFNYYLAGKYYEKYVVQYDNGLPNEKITSQFNPVDPDQALIPVGRFNNQLLVGLSCGIGQRLKLTASTNLGNRISYSHWRNDDISASFQNTDYIISLIYFFKPLIH